MKKTIVYATLLTASIAGTATSAIGGTGGPVDCITNEGCPTTILSEAEAPPVGWPEFDVERKTDEPVLIAGGWQCKVEVIVDCGPIRA